MKENPVKNKRYRQKIVGQDLVVAFLIITLPLLLNVHNYVSSDLTHFSFFGFTYYLEGYGDVSSLVFYLFVDLVKVSYISIWFITCKNNWYRAIIALLVLQSYLVIRGFNYELKFIEDEIRFFKFLKELGVGVFLTIIALPFLFFLRKRFNTYHVLHQVDKKLQSTTLTNSKSTGKNTFFFYAIIGIVVGYFIITQYLYYLKSNPDFDNSAIGFYQTKTTLFFVLIARITPILYLSLWLISCKYWWHHALVVPISVYVVQLYTALQINSNSIDKGEYLYIIPILVMVIGVLYFIRQNTLQKIERLSILEEVELRIEELKKKKDS